MRYLESFLTENKDYFDVKTRSRLYSVLHRQENCKKKRFPAITFLEIHNCFYRMDRSIVLLSKNLCGCPGHRNS